MAKRILILDDDPAFLDVMTDALSYEGFTTCCEIHTHNVVQLIKHHKPDILLVDYLLRGINGGELCSQVKKDANIGRLPVIILSAYPRVINSLGMYGCDAFIAKPFDLYLLIQKINELTASGQCELIPKHVYQQRN